ncbi:hypothetical protein K3G39_05725 [Pontibacter sp. HSC-14F20]|uniref:hypothetical protein n=1 Tax=Pontibacter sp. HSC-14F20 TaxID=2864136 RepID=UPI001C7356CD|nr:hypothetical protein [Pontibacter sp. HSC-14F20]MBX0332730.1 hypothetical protein [Pontibacter sp. HSC-14F20]
MSHARLYPGLFSLLLFPYKVDFSVNLFQDGANALILRYERTLQERRCYTSIDTTSSTTHYLSSPDKVLMRYRVSHTRDYSLGITAEKDAGEQFTWDPDTRRYGFDFYSAHLQLYNKGMFKAIALGDYQLQFGQGLLLSSCYTVGKGSETITTVSRPNVGIRPYSSVLEHAFYRGVAATYTFGRVDVTSFVSSKRIDANLQTQLDTLDNFDDFFTGIQTTGFHRTPSKQKAGPGTDYRRQCHLPEPKPHLAGRYNGHGDSLQLTNSEGRTALPALRV